MKIILVHVCDGDTAVPFSKFLESQQTPSSLVSAGIYNTLAIPLHHGDHRMQSMAMIVRLLLRPPGLRIPPVVGHQLGNDVSVDHMDISGSDHHNGVEVTCL